MLIEEFHSDSRFFVTAKFFIIKFVQLEAEMSEERSDDEDLTQKAIDYIIIENNQKIVKHTFEVSIKK